MPAAPSTVVRCSSLGHRYRNGRWGTRDVELALLRGEILCLLGPNGAGKTTLSRLVCGSLGPTTGFVDVLGEQPSHSSGRLSRRVGVAPQAGGLFERLRVRDHLELFGPIKGLTRRQSRTRSKAVLGELDLLDLEESRIAELSQGQRQRVLIALALLSEPELLILDEPSAGLDPAARVKLWDVLLEHRGAGGALLLTTHSFEEAERLGDRIGIVADGRVRRLGRLAELRADIAHPFSMSVPSADPSAENAVHYFDSLSEAHAYAAQHTLTRYSLAPVSLEDVYFRIIRSATGASSENG